MKGGSFHCLGCGKWWLTGLFTPLHRNVAVRGCMYGRETLLCGLPRPWSVNASSQSGEPRYFFFVVSPPSAIVESIRRFNDAYSTLKTIVLQHQTHQSSWANPSLVFSAIHCLFASMCSFSGALSVSLCDQVLSLLHQKMQESSPLLILRSQKSLTRSNTQH